MTTFNKVSKETKATIAIKMVILDAIERGLTTPQDAINYMQTDIFANAVKSYLTLMS